MSVLGVPDLLTFSQTSRSISRVNEDLARVSQELSSGLKSNLVKASGGDPTRLYTVEQDLKRNEVRQFAISQAQSRSEVTQSALDKVQGVIGEFGAPLLAAVTIDDQQGASIIASGARAAFSEVVGALNNRFGDRSLFAGAATDSPALADADVILTEISALTAGAADAAQVLTIVDTYFSDPTGFETSGYLGSVNDASDVELDNGEFVSYALRADASEIRDVLSSLAITVIGAEGGFAGDTSDERLRLLEDAGRRSLAANDQVIEIRGELGVAEERFERASVRLSAEEVLLSQARASIIRRDPFEAAIELSAIETQVQAVFSMTARLSALTLTNFIR